MTQSLKLMQSTTLLIDLCSGQRLELLYSTQMFCLMPIKQSLEVSTSESDNYKFLVGPGLS